MQVHLVGMPPPSPARTIPAAIRFRPHPLGWVVVSHPTWIMGFVTGFSIPFQFLGYCWHPSRPCLDGYQWNDLLWSFRIIHVPYCVGIEPPPRETLSYVDGGSTRIVRRILTLRLLYHHHPLIHRASEERLRVLWRHEDIYYRRRKRSRFWLVQWHRINRQPRKSKLEIVHWCLMVLHWELMMRNV